MSAEDFISREILMSNNDKNPTDGLTLFRVMLPWSGDCKPSDELGTYSTTTWAKSEAAAAREVAEEMADSGEVDFSSVAERKKFVESRCDGWKDVVNVKSCVQSDLSTIFEHELYGGGSRVQIDMDALRDLLVANKDKILKPVKPSTGVWKR